MKGSFLATLSVLLFAVGQVPAQEKKDFRLIGVPAREHGYGNFQSQVIDSQKQFEDFVKQVEAQQGWNTEAGFLKALADAKIDFTMQGLVLIRHTEGSGSNRVSFVAPEVKGDKLVCVIQRDVAGIGTADIADYCFAVAVAKGKAKEVEVWVNTQGAGKDNKPREVLPLKAK